MEYSNLIIIGLILAGAIILLLAVAKTYQILKLLTFKKFRRNWKNLFILMTFFFVGYLGVVYIVYIGMEDLLLVLTGVIFFFGAVFVYLVVLAGQGTFKKLHEVNEGLHRNVKLLETQNEDLRQFNYATSHDLQEPMNTVIGCVSMLKEQYGSNLDETANKYMKYSIQAAERSQEMVASLLLYLRIGHEEEISTTDLNKVIQEVLDEMQGSIQEANADISVSSMPSLEVSRDEIKRLFQNLISNAIKYRQPDKDPSINIKADKDNSHWLFTVEDNGIGIDANNAPSVFQIFKQLHKKGKYPGVGLGMSICKKIVELHGGTIWLESQEGQGTRFFFTLRGLKSA